MASVNTNITAYNDSVSKAGDIFSEYGDYIYSVIRFQSRNDTHAKDLFQDFFLSIVSNPPPPDVRNIKSYLYKAIVNDIVDAIRRLDSYHAQVRRYAHGFEYIPTKNKPENILIDIEEADKMFELIRSRLSPREAEAITLRYRHGHKIEEVAGKMSIDARTVSQYISIGLNKLRRFFRVQEQS